MNKVLIIEDDKEICFMIKDHLEKYNYQVFFTFTGANALERVKELTPDLIILDLMLPFISGDELIRTIRKFGELSIDTASKIVTVADEIIVLTAKEYQLLELLAKYPDKVFSKQNLYESIWQEPFARDNDVINTHISNLQKIKERRLPN